MSIITILKSNKVIRKFGKRINVISQFRHDTEDFLKYYTEMAIEQQDYRFSIMLLVHSLEKGMCFPDPRPFGAEKVKELIAMLNSYSDNRKKEFEYELGVSILLAWKAFYEDHKWESELGYQEVVAFIQKIDHIPGVKAGSKVYYPNNVQINERDYEKYIFSRHSVRDYQNREISREDIEFALKCFVETPTACNRQMCKVYYVINDDVKELLDRVVIGIPGFNKNTTHYFIITYDLASFAYSGERQQGLFNAGLCTMNFINGLHVKGIGSCCLQWSNKYKQDALVRKNLGLPKSERIGVVIGAGYYLDENTIPCSVRRSPAEIFRTI